MPIGQIEYHNSVTDQWTALPPADPSEEDGQRYVGGPNGISTFMYSEVPGASWTAPRLENARQYIQANILDNRIDRSTLPAEHPYIKDGDPALEWLFWDGTDVVERLVIAEALEVTADNVPRITLTRTYRPQDPDFGTELPVE